MRGAELANAALALVGTPFRLHGRDPRCGLDCVGVLAAALDAPLPNGYPLRARRVPDLSGLLAKLGLADTAGPIESGDVLMLRPGPCQFHLVIAVPGDRVVHAHAGLRKVVRGPLPGDWPIARHWRLAADTGRT